ncbi:MAG: hypothetical protein JXB49_32115 [Bacteroidales bacterium]|nr:hypothetical protein [Bacteroidales bacterium]
MKIKYYYKIIIYIIVVFCTNNIFAQDEIIFDPSELIPHDDGYYIVGVYVDENEDGILEYHNKCEDYYEVTTGPANTHQETGTQQDFRYENVMIMPTCPTKYDPVDPPMPDGYVQLAPGWYPNTDSTFFSAIYSPPIKNLESIELALSADVSIQPGKREIPYNIQFSEDLGETWVDDVYILDILSDKAGNWITYTSESDLNFEEMVNSSEGGTIILRISSAFVDYTSSMGGQYVKVHQIKIIAEKQEDVVINIDENKISNKRFFMLNNRNIISQGGIINVFNFSGQLIGSGKSVVVSNSGIYLILSDEGNAQKVFIK